MTFEEYLNEARAAAAAVAEGKMPRIHVLNSTDFFEQVNAGAGFHFPAPLSEAQMLAYLNLPVVTRFIGAECEHYVVLGDRKIAEVTV